MADFKPLLLLWVLALLAAPALADERLSASVDRDRIAVNETFELTIEWRPDTRRGEAPGGNLRGDHPHLDALQHHFEVLRIGQSSQTSMSGADPVTICRWHVTLRPKEAGTLVIPSFHLAGAVSEALMIEVSEADPNARAEQRFWLESRVDREQAHIGEQVMLIYRLYYASPLRQMSRSDLEVEGAEVVSLQERQFQTVIDGVEFQVAELRFAVFAFRDGTMTIPPLQLDGYSHENTHSRFGSLIRGLGDPVRLRSEPHQIEILPRPENAGAGPWLPARGVRLSEQWSHQDQALRVGEPVTRTVRVDAQGVKAQQLPELDFGEQDGFRVYPEQPRLGQREDDNGLLASRVERHALIASRPGTLTLPAVRVQWWDTDSDQMRETVLPERTLEVLPAPDARTDATTPAAESETTALAETEARPRRYSMGLGLSLMANVILFLLVVLLWRRGRPARPRVSEATAPPERHQLERRLQQLAKADDARAFRAAIIEWGRVQWPAQAPTTLSEIAALADRPQLTLRLRELDEALYDHGTQPAAELKGAIVSELKAVPPAHASQERRAALPPLYR